MSTRALKETSCNYFNLGKKKPISLSEIADAFRRPSVLIESTVERRPYFRFNYL